VRWLAVAVVMLASAEAAAVPCRVSEPPPAILTSATATVDDTGGVVAAHPKPGWELSQSSQLKELVLRTIAPGLVVIALPTNGSFELRDAKKALLANAMRGPTKISPLGPPKGSAVMLSAPQARGAATTITAILKAKAPASAVALIVYVKGKARSWGRVTAGASSVVVYKGACQVTPPVGTIASRVRDSVNLAWLDETGHLSAPSAAVKIR
jgi:hypothetical protein